MAIAERSQSTTERPLALRRRGDLEFCEQQFAGRTYWAVKDPVALSYFHLREEEYRLLTLLDGRAGLEEIRRRANEAFAPRRLTSQQVQGFLATLHRYGLVLADSPGQGRQLAERRDEKLRRRRFGTLLGILAIRFPGANPRSLLDWLFPKCGWIFSAPAVACVLALAVAALVLVAVQFDVLRSRLPDFEAITAASNLPWLVVALAGTKILHELGHAVACRRFGGDCHEIGLMLLVFTPCLYCNVSDSWMIRDKWRRIAIAAAGMYVELILASVCTFLWWFSQPGLFNALCLNVVLVCSLGTLLFNGNPLLRYDGYFILSDLVEVPNLKSQSTWVVRSWLARWCLGIDLGEDRGLPPRRQVLLALYAVASTVYRYAIVVLVLWVLFELARPYHLEVLVLPVAALTLIGVLWPSVEVALHWAGDPARRRRLAPARVAATCLALVAALAAFLWVPLPARITAPAMLEYRDAAHIYVTEPGVLKNAARVGQSVQQGDVLAVLANPDVDLELTRLTADRDSQRLFLTNLESRRLEGGLDSAQIPSARAALDDAEQRLAQVRRDATELTITAPQAGTVLPAGAVTPDDDRGQLAHWSGTPLDPRNLGTTLKRGTLLCLVGDPRHFEAVVHVDDADVERIRVGARVRVAPDHQPGHAYQGAVVEIARLDLDVMPRELAAAGDLPAHTDERGLSRPLDTWYQVRVAFDEDPPRQVARVHGRAKIDVAPQSLGARLARYLKQTFGR